MEYYSAMKKQQTRDTQQIDKSQEYNVNWKKPDSKENVSYASICIKF